MYVLPKWGETRLSGITEERVNEWREELKNAAAPYDMKGSRKPRKPSVRYLRQIVYSVFGAVCRYAVLQGWLNRSPLANVKIATKSKNTLERDKVFLQPEELKALADAAKLVGGGRELDSVVVLFLAYSGLRLGEAFALRVGDIDMERQRVAITKTKTLDEEGHVTEGPPKNGDPRVVALPRFITAMLKPYVEVRDAGDYLFTSSRGVSLDMHNWRSRIFSPAIEGAGLGDVDGLRPHSLRHTFASMSIKAGCDVRTLAAAMSYKDITITLNEYAGLWPDRLGEVADALESYAPETVIVSNYVPRPQPKATENPQNVIFPRAEEWGPRGLNPGPNDYESFALTD